MPYPPSEVDVLLEYRVAVLDGIVDSMLSNGVFTKSLESNEMEQIHERALLLVRRAHSDTKIELKGRWLR